MIQLQLAPWPLVGVRVAPLVSGDGASVETLAIVDTGAQVTLISEDLFVELGVAPMGTRRVRSLGDVPKRAPRAPFVLSVLDRDGAARWSESMPIVGGFQGEKDGAVRCLLGLDVLRHSSFRLDGQVSSATLEFPGY